MKYSLKALIEQSDNIVFFGGAGVSTESGIPDFRSQDGLYSQKYDHPPETILSHSFLMEHPLEFFNFYRDKIIHREAKPNRAHIRLAELERIKKLTAVITQNIDGLHQLAGSLNVIELHGSINNNYCMNCQNSYGLDAIADTEGIPRCSCGGIIRPDVVLYEETLDEKVLEAAERFLCMADMLIVGGTSLTVYPAAGLINYYNGDKLVLINKSITPYDDYANYVFTGSIGEILG